MSNHSGRGPGAPSAKPPPDHLPEQGILLGYSLEHQRRTAPIGFSYGDPPPESVPEGAPTLDPILHTGGGHLLTIAPTGAGKGISCIIPSLLRYPGPVIVIDPKGENYAVTAERRRALGQEVVVLDPIGITNAPEPGALNPLDLIDPADAQSIDDTAALASLLSGGIEKEDPRNLFWYQRGEQLLTGIIQLVAVTRTGGDRTLGEVRRILNLPSADFLQLAATQMAHCSDADVRQVAGTLVNPAQEMIGSILGMAQNSLGFLRGERVHASTSTSTFALADITAGAPVSIYLVIPPDKLESHRNLLRVWIGTLMSALMRRRAPVANGTLLILDEAAQLGPLDQLRQAVTLMRGYGLQTWSFWQDLSQLLNLYPRDWETMYNNCRVHQAFGFTTLKAATATCDLLGFHDPLEALRLDVDEMILSVSGDEAVIAQKPNYLTDPAFNGMYASNPFYTRSGEEPPKPARPTRVYVRPAEEEDSGPDVGPSYAADAEQGSGDQAAGPPGEDGPGARDPAPVRRGAGLLDPLPGVRMEDANAVPFVLELVRDRLGGAWNPITAHIRGISPSFWADHHIVEVSDPTQERERQLVLVRQRDIRAFDGRASEFRTLLREIPTTISADTVAEWVRIYLHFARWEDERIRLVETVDQLRYWTGAHDVDLGAYATVPHPIRVVGGGEDVPWELEAVELTEGALRSVRIEVGRDGEIGAIARDRVLAALDLPLDYPTVGLDGAGQDPLVADELRDIHGRWELLVEVDRHAALRRLSNGEGVVLDWDADVLRRALRCAPGWDLLRIGGEGPSAGSFAFSGPEVAWHISHRHPGYLRAFARGTPADGHPPLRLDDPEAVKEYLRLHTWFMGGTAGDSVLLLDRFDQLPIDASAATGTELHNQLRARWVPLTVAPPRADDPDVVAARATGTALQGGHIRFLDFTVGHEATVGLVESDRMEHQMPLDEGRLLRLLAMPPLGRPHTQVRSGTEGTP